MCCRIEYTAGGISVDAKQVLSGRRKEPEDKRRDEGGKWRLTSLLTDLCFAMRSDPLGMIRGLGESVTCVYGPAVLYAFPDPLVAAYRMGRKRAGPIEAYPKFWNLNAWP